MESRARPQGRRRRWVSLLIIVLAAAMAARGSCQRVDGGLAAADVRALKGRAKQCIETRRYAEAVEVLQEALEAQPHDAEARVWLGRAQANLGRLDLAEDSYKHALRVNASYSSATTALGKLYLYQGKTEASRAQFEQTLAVDPLDADSWLGLGKLELMHPGDRKALGRAEGYYRRSLELLPKNEQALFDYGVLLSHLGRHEDAARSFSSAVVLNPTINFTLLGQVYQTFEQWPRAADTFRAAIERDPGDVNALYCYGQVSEMMGNRREAMSNYNRVLELEPEHADAHASLGLLLVGTGLVNYGAQQACGLNRDEAMWHFHQAILANPLLKVANDSLEFCLREEVEERRWAERVSALKRHVSDAGPPKGKFKTDAEKDEPGSDRRGGLSRFVRRVRGRLQKLRQAWSDMMAGCRSGGRGTREKWINGNDIQHVAVDVARTPEELMRYVRSGTPVVIKNFQDDFAGRDQWTKEALKRKFGHMPVRVSVSQTGRFDGPEDGRLWGLRSTDEVLVRPPTAPMRFADFIDLLDLASRPKGSDLLRETFYLEYLSFAQFLGPEMRNMVPMPRPAEASGMEWLLTNFWMGKGNTTSPLHYDDYENLLAVIRGRKELLLFPPADIVNLYYTGRAKGVLEYEYPGTFRRNRLVHTQHAVVFGSSVNLDSPDLTRHPLIIRATPYKVNLDEGDTLYLPAYWHHEVKSHPDPEGLNIAVNFWYRNMTAFAEEQEGLRIAAQMQARLRESEEL